MNMKKMRGVVDPLTLGWVLATVVMVISASNVSNSAQDEKAQQKINEANGKAYVQQNGVGVKSTVYKRVE